MPPVLELEEVVKRYPGEPPVEALGGVSLTIRGGELVAVVGQSGSGKTTLVHVMGTLERPTEGVVRVAGQDVSTMSDRQLSGLRAWRLGFVFQQFFLLDGLSVVENVAHGLLYRGARPAPRPQRRGRPAGGRGGDRQYDAHRRPGAAHRDRLAPRSAQPRRRWDCSS